MIERQPEGTIGHQQGTGEGGASGRSNNLMLDRLFPSALFLIFYPVARQDLHDPRIIGTPKMVGLTIWAPCLADVVVHPRETVPVS